MQTVPCNFGGDNADLPLKTMVDTLFCAIRPYLTERQYEVLVLRRREGLSGKEIAARLHVTQTNVSRLLGEAERRVRELAMVEEP